MFSEAYTYMDAKFDIGRIYDKIIYAELPHEQKMKLYKGIKESMRIMKESIDKIIAEQS